MKSVFITGAGAGIGLATARRFASQGWLVGLYDIDREAVAAAVNSGEFPSARGGYCDVTDRASVRAAVTDFANYCHGKINVVVNNAGVLSAGPFVDIDPSANDRMIDVNVRGFTDVALLAFPYLQAADGACLVNLCSASSIHGVPNLAVYSATKFYVNAMTQALHLEWKQHNIRVTCVKPHLVDTPMAHEVTQRSADGARIALTPDDIATAIDRAVSGHRLSYIIGREARLWALLDKWLPESLRLWLTRRLLQRA